MPPRELNPQLALLGPLKMALGGGGCPLAWAIEDASEKVGADAPSLGPSKMALGGGEGA